MGVDLTIVPQRHYNGEFDWFLAYDRISVDRNYDLFEEINKVESQELPDAVRFDWYADEGLERRTTDPYGKKLKFVLCRDLAKAFSTCKELSQRDTALMKYLEALPDNFKAVLWWH